MSNGLQRDGLKAAEVFQIRKAVERMLQDGEDPDIAYSLACREIVGVDAATFKAWKPDIFKLIEGKPTPANSLLSGSLDPSKATPKDSAAFKRIEQIGGELDAAKKDHARLLEDNEKLQEQLEDLKKLREDNKKLQEQLAASVLGEPTKPTAPVKPAKPDADKK